MSDITQKEINQVNTIKGFLLDGHHYISYIGKRLASDFRTNLSSSIDCVTKDLAEKDQQLAAAKAEIAELRSDMKFMCEMHDRSIYWQSDADRINAILAKHKGE